MDTRPPPPAGLFADLKPPRGRPLAGHITPEQRAARPLNTQQKTGQPIQNVGWWHEQLTDWELLNPAATLQDAADYFGVTPAWLSTVRNSDAFKEYRAGIMQAHRAKVSATVIEKVEGLAHLSLDILEERIAAERDEIALGFVKETAEMALKSMGYSGRVGGNGTNVQVNVGVQVGADDLARAREKHRAHQELLEHKSLRVITHETKETVNGDGAGVGAEDRTPTQPSELVPTPERF